MAGQIYGTRKQGRLGEDSNAGLKQKHASKESTLEVWQPLVGQMSPTGRSKASAIRALEDAWNHLRFRRLTGCDAPIFPRERIVIVTPFPERAVCKIEVSKVIEGDGKYRMIVPCLPKAKEKSVSPHACPSQARADKVLAQQCSVLLALAFYTSSNANYGITVRDCHCRCLSQPLSECSPGNPIL